MSLGQLLGTLTGGTQSKFAKKGSEALIDGINKAYDGSVPLVESGFAGQRDYLGQGYTTGGQTLAGGYQDATGFLTGARDTARTELSGGYGRAQTSLTDAYDRALASSARGLETIEGYYQPYLQAGQRAQGLYGDFLGLNGAGRAQSASANFAGNDPGIAYRLDTLGQQSAMNANAAGNLGSGREAAARTRAQSEVLSTDYQNYLSRLERQSGLGGQYAGQISGYTDAAAGRDATLNARYGDTSATLYRDEGRDLAQVEERTGRSLSDLVSQYTGRLADRDTAYYGAMGNNALGENMTLAGLLGSRETGIGAARAGQYAAQSAGYSQGMNNIIGIGTAIASAATGVPMGRPGGSGGGSTTTPGTQANGGWTTTTTPAPTSSWGNWFS